MLAERMEVPQFMPSMGRDPPAALESIADPRGSSEDGESGPAVNRVLLAKWVRIPPPPSSPTPEGAGDRLDRVVSAIGQPPREGHLTAGVRGAEDFPDASTPALRRALATPGVQRARGRSRRGSACRRSTTADPRRGKGARRSIWSEADATAWSRMHISYATMRRRSSWR